MIEISLVLNALLVALLVGALALGWRLDLRLRALEASHRAFALSVGDFDRAAARAEQGLADLRAAAASAGDTLAARVDQAQRLAARLEQLTLAAPAQASPSATPAQVRVRPETIARIDRLRALTQPRGETRGRAGDDDLFEPASLKACA